MISEEISRKKRWDTSLPKWRSHLGFQQRAALLAHSAAPISRVNTILPPAVGSTLMISACTRLPM